MTAVLAACDAPARARTSQPTPLDAAQRELIASIADHIIPPTDTPGARGAGVPRFIETMLNQYYTPDERQRVLDGLHDVDRRALKELGLPFLRSTPGQQRTLLEAIDREAYAVHVAPTPFFRTMKELTILGYYTSEIGATKELHYERIPGRYDGCVKLARIGRAWAV